MPKSTAENKEDKVHAEADFILKRMNTATIKMIKGKKTLEDLL
jgi:hypothetical protein